MTKTFCVDTFHATFHFKVDMEEFSKIAQEMNEFWMDSESRLKKRNGCHVKATLSIIAGRIACYMIGEGYHAKGALKHLSQQEGFPANLCEMVECVYDDVPEFSSEEWDVEEVK